MHCNDRTIAQSAFRNVAVLALSLLCACGKSSTAPSPADSPPVAGKWLGSIVAPGIADGTVSLVLIPLTGPAALPNSFRGTYEIEFQDAAFNARGGVSALFDPSKGNTLLTTFDPAPVPCPGAPGGVKQEPRVAVLTIVGNRAEGRYLTGSCPFGTITLVRQ